MADTRSTTRTRDNGRPASRLWPGNRSSAKLDTSRPFPKFESYRVGGRRSRRERSCAFRRIRGPLPETFGRCAPSSFDPPARGGLRRILLGSNSGRVWFASTLPRTPTLPLREGRKLRGRSRRSFRGGVRECATQVGFTRLGRFIVLNSATAKFSGAGASTHEPRIFLTA